MTPEERRQLARDVVAMVGDRQPTGFDAVGLSAEKSIAAGENVCRHGNFTLIRSGSVIHGGWKWVCADDCPQRDEGVGYFA